MQKNTKNSQAEEFQIICINSPQEGEAHNSPHRLYIVNFLKVHYERGLSDFMKNV